MIDTAKNGLTTIEKVKKLKPDVVTIGIKTPDTSGLDVLNEVIGGTYSYMCNRLKVVTKRKF